MRNPPPTTDCAVRLSWPAVSARRLARQGLAEPLPDASPADVVAAMCGAHAQVLSAAELSIAVRLSGATRSDIRQALWTERSLVKTFGPRGTVHLLPTRDLPLWSGALSAVPTPRSPFAAEVQLTGEQTEQVLAAIADALADDELTIDELSDAVVRRTGSWAGDLVMPAFQDLWPRWRQVLALAGRRGALCFGPNRGRHVTYTSPRRWLPNFVPDDGPVAIRALLRRYLTAYGPATPQHFAKWLNASTPWAAELFAGLGAEIEPVDLAGSVAWQLTGDDCPATDVTGVRLLPYFDAFAVASQPRELLFPGRVGERALARGQAGNFPVLLIDGTVSGVWHLKRSGRKAAITVEPGAPLRPGHVRALERQVARTAEILEADVTLTVGPVMVGAHA